MDVEIIQKTKVEKHREAVKKNYYKNKEKKLNSVMENRKKNPEKYREYHRLYYHRKLKKVIVVPNDYEPLEEVNLLENGNT